MEGGRSVGGTCGLLHDGSCSTMVIYVWERPKGSEDDHPGVRCDGKWVHIFDGDSWP